MCCIILGKPDVRSVSDLFLFIQRFKVKGQEKKRSSQESSYGPLEWPTLGSKLRFCSITF